MVTSIVREDDDDDGDGFIPPQMEVVADYLISSQQEWRLPGGNEFTSNRFEVRGVFEDAGDGTEVRQSMPVSGEVLIESTSEFNVFGSITGTGDFEFLSDATIGGGVSMATGLIAPDATVVSGGDGSFGGDLTIDGELTVDGDVTVDGQTEIDGELRADGETLSGTATISGDGRITKTEYA